MNPHLEEALEMIMDEGIGDKFTVATLQELIFDISCDPDGFEAVTGVGGEEMLDALCLLISWYGVPGKDFEPDGC